MEGYILLGKKGRWNKYTDDVVSITKSNVNLKNFLQFQGRVNVFARDDGNEIKIVKDEEGRYNINKGVMSNRQLIDRFGKSLWKGVVDGDTLILTKI